MPKFRDPEKSGNYNNHYSCYNCPTVPNPYRNIPIWKRPCTYIMKDNEPGVIYLYLPSLKLWLDIFKFEEHPFTDIKDENNQIVLRINSAIDIFSISPSSLENKIKTWILFS